MFKREIKLSRVEIRKDLVKFYKETDKFNGNLILDILPYEIAKNLK